MADKKISQLSNATTPLAGTEVLPIVQSGSTVKVTVDNLTKGKVVNALSFDTDVAAAGVTLTGVTLAADGTDTNIDINITPKGTGEVNITKVDIDAGAIDGTAIGANSASTGAFTSVTTSGNTTVSGSLGAGVTPIAKINSQTGASLSLAEQTYTGDAFLISGAGITAGLNTYGSGITWSRLGINGRRRAAIASVQTTSDEDQVGLAFFTHPSTGLTVDIAESMRLDHNANLKVGGTASRATTVGTNHIDIFNGTAPAGTLADGISLYSSSGEAYVMDAAGNATLFSPHDRQTNEWIFRSKHTPTGKVVKIDVERLLRFVNDHFGLDAVHDFIEE